MWLSYLGAQPSPQEYGHSHSTRTLSEESGSLTLPGSYCYRASVGPAPKGDLLTTMVDSGALSSNTPLTQTWPP